MKNSLDVCQFENQEVASHGSSVMSIVKRAKNSILSVLSLLAMGSGCVDLDSAAAKMKEDMAATLEEKLDEKMGDTAALLQGLNNCETAPQEEERHMSLRLADQLLRARTEQGLVDMSCNDVQEMVREEIIKFGIYMFDPRDVSFWLKDERTIVRLAQAEDRVLVDFDRGKWPSGYLIGTSYEEPDPLVGTSISYKCKTDEAPATTP